MLGFLLNYIRKLTCPAFRTVRDRLVHAFVRITPGHEKTGTCGRFFFAPGDIRRGKESLSRPIKRTYSAEVTSLSRAISCIIADCALGRRSVIIQHRAVCVKLFLRKISSFFFPFSSPFPQHNPLCFPAFSATNRRAGGGAPPIDRGSAPGQSRGRCKSARCSSGPGERPPNRFTGTARPSGWPGAAQECTHSEESGAEFNKFEIGEFASR